MSILNYSWQTALTLGTAENVARELWARGWSASRAYRYARTLTTDIRIIDKIRDEYDRLIQQRALIQLKSSQIAERLF